MNINKKIGEKEELIIINKYQDLIMYVYMLLDKFPVSEKVIVGGEIKKYLFQGLELLFYAKRAYSKREKLKYLREVDVKLSCLKVYIRVVLKKKLINRRNYKAWSYKITSIGNLLGGWINSCLAH